MNGARNYCRLFKKAEQIGRLYILPHCHARGKTFRIYVLPEGEKVIENAGINPPLNKDAVEVYGVVSGHPGWTESYGWKHEGKWQEDFGRIVTERGKEQLQKDISEHENRHKVKEFETKRLLDDYLIRLSNVIR